MTRAEARRYRESIEQAAALQSDEQALENIYLYPQWEAGKAVQVNERYRYGETLYKCIQAHITQADWTPDVTPALWVVVSLDEFPAWRQPTGSTDSYMKGDKVSHLEKHWVSDIDNNVWEPGATGTESLWHKVE